MAFIETFNLPDKKNDILLIGEIVIDEIQDNELNKTKKLFGGSPANIAVNLHSLGIIPQFFGAVGNDESGLFLKNELNIKGINIENVKTFRTKTTTVKIENKTNTPSPVFTRASDYHIYYTKELEASLVNVKIVHFSYWPLSKEPAKSTIESVIEFCKKNDTIIGFDPNYHRDLETTDSISIDELKIMMGQVDIIKPSLDDSKRIFGDGFTIEEYMMKYQKLGCKLIVMTLGEDGVIASYKGEMIKMPSVAKEIKDVTGAGDAFWSGLYAAILKGDTIYNAIKIGLICSSYSLKQLGAVTNLPKLSDIKKEIEM